MYFPCHPDCKRIYLILIPLVWSCNCISLTDYDLFICVYLQFYILVVSLHFSETISVKLLCFVCVLSNSFWNGLRATGPAALSSWLWSARSGGSWSLCWSPSSPGEGHWGCLCAESHEQDSFTHSRKCKIHLVCKLKQASKILNRNVRCLDFCF